MMDIPPLGPMVRHFLNRLHVLYADMDCAYEQVAAVYGFACHGCADNCCRSHFHHHTLLERLDLEDGLRQMTNLDHRAVIRRAAAGGVDAECPLWQDERCRLYAHRPMICRLHGLPHRLDRPDRVAQVGPGCEEFHRRCGPARERLDRTPLYRALAALEGELRRKTGFRERIHMTVAEMIIAGRWGQVGEGG